MRFSHFFVDRPIFAGVISIIITLVGFISFRALPVAEYPEIAPPTVNVTASYAGASAEVIAQTVAAPIEQEINGVDNMLYVVSQATGNGALAISVVLVIVSAAVGLVIGQRSADEQTLDQLLQQRRQREELARRRRADREQGRRRPAERPPHQERSRPPTAGAAASGSLPQRRMQ